MSSRRLARLNEQVKREISELLRAEVRDPRVGLPTVTAVEVTADLWLARVYVRPGPVHAPEDMAELLEGLKTAAPFIRRALGKTLKVRRIPELRFLPDRTLDEARKIERILQDVLPDEPGSSAAREDDLEERPSDDEQCESGSR